MKRLHAVILLLCLIVVLLPLPAYANGPAPMPMLYFKLINLPEGTVYVDLAVEAPQKQIVDLAQQPPDGLSEDCPLVLGEYDGYVSYTFRVRGSQSNIVPDKENHVFFAHDDDIPKWGEVRLVMADAQGQILKISKSFDIDPKGLFENSLNYFVYDGNSDCLQMDTYVSSAAWLVYIIIGLFGILLTCSVEWIVGTMFRITAAYGKEILLTNACSQVAMRILFLILYSMMPHYVLIMTLLELLVYVGEYIGYRRILHGISRKKCLWYVVIANTASLLLGMLLNLYLI